MKKQIAVNIFSNYAGRAVGMALGFFLVPFLIWKLGVETFGIIVLFEALIHFTEVISISVRVALSRHATFALSQGKTEEFTEYLSTGRAIFFVIAGIVLVIGLTVSQLAPHLFKLPAEHVIESEWLFAMMTVTFAMTIPNFVFWTGLYAKQRFDLINLSQSAGLILRAAAIFALFSFLPPAGVTLITYGLVYLLMTWGQNFFVYLCFRKVLPEIRIRLSKFKREKMKSIVSFSSYTLVSHSAWAFSENMINILINVLWGPAANAMYAIGMKFNQVMRRFFDEPVWTLTPTFTDLVAKGEMDKLKQLTYFFTKIMAFVTIPITLFLMAFSEPIIHLWVGTGFEEAVRLMFWSLIPLVYGMPTTVCNNFPNAFAKVKLPSLVHVTNVPVYFGAAYVFAKMGDQGLVGLAMAGIVISAGYVFFFTVPYACYLAGFSKREYWTTAYLRPFLWALVVWGVFFWSVRPLMHSMTEVSVLLIVGVGACLVVYLAGGYAWVLDEKERIHVRELWVTLKARLMGGL